MVPVGEDEAVYFMHPPIGIQTRLLGWWPKRCGSATTGGVEREAVERADEIAASHDAAGIRSDVSAEVWAERIGHAHHAGAIPPSDDLAAHPLFLQELAHPKLLMQTPREAVRPAKEPNHD